jgi:predicted metal-dependent phosphoesterase TrpH
MKADFHMHSTHSDGTKTIDELFQKAKEEGLDVFSITDHDTCQQVEYAKELAASLNIRFIPGIELSTVEDEKPVHVLGYFTDESYKSKEMKDYYVSIKQGREDRARSFISKLKQHFDIEITYDLVKSFSRGIIARPHIAKAINHEYPQYSFDYIFDHFIGNHSKAYVPTTELKVEEGIDLLRRNNCLVILAHPTLLKESIKDKVLSYDFDGLEAKYYRNKEGEEDLFRALAQKNNWIVSAGSDYHGIENDSKHGYIGQVTLEDNDLKAFLALYESRKQV